MSAKKQFQGRAWFALLSSLLVAALLSGCAAQTVVDSQSQTGPLKVSMTLDPNTLNPPQTGTISLGLTDAATGKPYTTFESTSGALMHTVVISKDLLHFRHTYTQELVDSRASMYSYFPTFGTYMVYSIFKPQNQPVQVHNATITTVGKAGGDAQLVEEPSLRKTTGWLQFQLLKDAGTIQAGKPTQLAFYITERGRPVNALWPYLGAPGQLWIVDDKAENFAHIVGSAESRNLLQEGGAGASATGTPAAMTGTTSSNTGSTSNAPASGTLSGGIGTPGMEPSPQAAPSLVAGVADALSTVSAAPTQQLASVQQTAQSSVLGTPDVLPSTAYGPLVAFTHTFPHAGLYKCWLEVYYRGQVVTVDYVLRVGQ